MLQFHVSFLTFAFEWTGVVLPFLESPLKETQKNMLGNFEMMGLCVTLNYSMCTHEDWDIFIEISFNSFDLREHLIPYEENSEVK